MDRGMWREAAKYKKSLVLNSVFNTGDNLFQKIPPPNEGKGNS